MNFHKCWGVVFSGKPRRPRLEQSHTHSGSWDVNLDSTHHKGESAWLIPLLSSPVMDFCWLSVLYVDRETHRPLGQLTPAPLWITEVTSLVADIWWVIDSLFYKWTKLLTELTVKIHPPANVIFFVEKHQSIAGSSTEWFVLHKPGHVDMERNVSWRCWKVTLICIIDSCLQPLQFRILPQHNRN